MISRFGNKNFFAAHYDWIAAGVGLLALAAGAVFFALSLGEDPDVEAAAEVRSIERLKPSETGVKSVDMAGYQSALTATRKPAVLAAVSEKGESFLASERRVLCSKCKKAIPGDVKVCPVCPFCGTKQEEEKKIVVDADGDGLPDEWEARYGLSSNNPADANADTDGDGFTNLEEFLAKTDPTDRNDHPDYLDSLSIVLPLQETKMPFVFRKANKIPGGWRCEFVDPSRKNDYGQMGRPLTAKIGDPIADKDPKSKVDYGFVLKSYTQKSEKREKAGMKGMFVSVDVSEVVVERVRDGKKVTLVVQSGSQLRLSPVDIQATLAYQRGEVKNFEVTPGSEIELNGTKYRIVDIKAVGKGAKVTVEAVATGKKRVLEALER